MNYKHIDVFDIDIILSLFKVDFIPPKGEGRFWPKYLPLVITLSQQHKKSIFLPERT